MKLEVNLVKKQTIDSGLGTLLSRNRYSVSDGTEAISAIQNFIADQSSTFVAANKDQRFNSILSNLTGLTWTQLDGIRYMLSVNSGLDLWYWYVADEERNYVDIESGMFEYNIIDMNTIVGNIPYTSKLEQSNQENNLLDVYTKIIESYGLFNGPIFAGMKNPLMTYIDASKASMELIGKIPQVQTTSINYILSFLHKEIKVLVP